MRPHVFDVPRGAGAVDIDAHVLLARQRDARPAGQFALRPGAAEEQHRAARELDASLHVLPHVDETDS